MSSAVRARVVEYFSQYDPDKLDSIDELMEKVGSDEQILQLLENAKAKRIQQQEEDRVITE